MSVAGGTCRNRGNWRYPARSPQARSQVRPSSPAQLALQQDNKAVTGPISRHDRMRSCGSLQLLSSQGESCFRMIGEPRRAVCGQHVFTRRLGIERCEMVGRTARVVVGLCSGSVSRCLAICVPSVPLLKPCPLSSSVRRSGGAARLAQQFLV